MNCLNCQCETNNPKFCSKSCATSSNNRNNPKRTLQGNCRSCQKPIQKSRKFCKECRPLTIRGDLTLQEAIYKKHHVSSAYALIRKRARAMQIKRGLVSCEKCGYDKHFEACHKTAISTYPLDTLISEINKPENLISLCPNCHWELDNLD